MRLPNTAFRSRKDKCYLNALVLFWSYLLLPIFIFIAIIFSLPGWARASDKSGDAAENNKAIFVVDKKCYYLNGSLYEMDVVPFVEQGRVFVPLRYLARALGINDKNIIWDAATQSINLRDDKRTVKLALNSQLININDNQDYDIIKKSYIIKKDQNKEQNTDSKTCTMDTSPVLKNGRVFLPARWIAEAFGYTIEWDERFRALLVGSPGNLPTVNDLPAELIRINVRPCEWAEDSLYLERELSSSFILFSRAARERANIYNAGIAAGIINGLVLAPNEEFSFNRVVGKRTAARGFITGRDARHNLVIGGGVCRTATVIFQAAQKAGLKITERHPHFPPVDYTPPGTDAAVEWNKLDLKFINTRPLALKIHTGIAAEERGQKLWATLYERQPLQRARVNVEISNQVYELDSLLLDDLTYVSVEQLSDLYRFAYKITEENEAYKVSINFNGQMINITEKSKTADINNIPMALSGEPFTLNNCNCKFWLPLPDWLRIYGKLF